MEYCRLCMDMEEDNLCSMSSSIRTCIMKEYSVEINENDELSKGICRTCEAFVTEIAKFREKMDGFGDKINKVQKLLQKIKKSTPTRANSDTIIEDAPITIEKPCSDKTPRKSDKPIAFEDLTSDMNVSSSSSNDVISKIIRSIDLDEVERTAHQMRITSNPENNNFCTVCKIKAVDAAKFQRHLESSAHIFKAYVIKQSGDHDIFTNYLVGYKCPFCRESFTSKIVLSTHSKRDHKYPLNKNNLKPNTLIRKNIKFNEDDSAKKDEEVLPEIIVKEEPDSSETMGNPTKTHLCVVCKKAFGFSESLQRHQQKHHKETLFCRYCPFITINARTFSEHLRKHFNLRYFQRICSLCFKVCQSYGDLTAHRKEVHETTIVQVCLLCNEKFPTTTLLKKHKRDVHRTQSDDVSRENKFKCRKCNRGFMSVLVLEKHQCTTMKYPCVKKCGRRFEHFGEMERHAAKCNSGRTIYCCKRCQKSLKTMASYKTHLKKCSLKVSVPSVEKTNVKSAEKLQKTSENQASCSTLMQPPPAETNDVSKKHRIDFAETTERKKIKTAPISRGILNCTNTKILKKVVKKTLRKTPKRIIKKKPKSKLTRVKKVTGPEKKKLTKLEENLKPQIPSSNSTGNSKTQEQTMACQTCGLVFKDFKFLAEHKSTVHSSAASENNKHVTEVFKKEKNEIQPAIGLSEVPNCDDTNGVWKPKWKPTPSPPKNHNVILVRDVEISVSKSNSSLVGQETKKNDTADGESIPRYFKPFTRESMEFAGVTKSSLTRNDVERPEENLSSGSKNILSSSKSSKMVETNQGTSTRNDIDHRLEYRSPGPKNVSFSSESSNITEKNQTTSNRNDVDHPEKYRLSGSKSIISSSKSSKMVETNQGTSTRNDIDHRLEYRSPGPKNVSFSSESSNIAEKNQTTSNRNDVDHPQKYRSSEYKTKSSSWFKNDADCRSSESKTISSQTSSRNDVNYRPEYRSFESNTSSSYKSSKFAETPTRNRRDSFAEKKRSQPNLEKRYSSSSEISPRTPRNDVEVQRFQPRSGNHSLDFPQKTHSKVEKPIEMNLRRPTDYNKDRSSSRHHIPRPQYNRWDGPDRRNSYTQYTQPTRIDRRKSNQNRYPENPSASSSSRLEPRTDSKQGPVMKSPTIAPSTSEMSRQDNTSKKSDLTIISISRSPICGICKNPESHLFCNPCSRCFLKNEVQYFNHMKMKHS